MNLECIKYNNLISENIWLLLNRICLHHHNSANERIFLPTSYAFNTLTCYGMTNGMSLHMSSCMV